MTNMSYCRFRNTLSDLRDCYHALDELIDAGLGKLSDDELRAAGELIQECASIVNLCAEVDIVNVDIGDVDADDAPANLKVFNDDADTLKAIDLSDDERWLITMAINTASDGGHPAPDEDSLGHFTIQFTFDCLSTCLDRDVIVNKHDEQRAIKLIERLREHVHV